MAVPAATPTLPARRGLSGRRLGGALRLYGRVLAVWALLLWLAVALGWLWVDVPGWPGRLLDTFVSLGVVPEVLPDLHLDMQTDLADDLPWGLLWLAGGVPLALRPPRGARGRLWSTLWMGCNWPFLGSFHGALASLVVMLYSSLGWRGRERERQGVLALALGSFVLWHLAIEQRPPDGGLWLLLLLLVLPSVLVDELWLKPLLAAQADRLTRERALSARLRDSAAALARSREAALAVSASRLALIHSVSHDLGNALFPVSAFALPLRQSADTAAADAAQRIVDANGHALALVDHLVTHARLEAGVIEAADDPVDLRQLLDSVVRSAEPAALAAGMTLRQRAVGPLCALVDRTLLQRVLLNLVINAIRHGGAVKRSRGRRVLVALRRRGGEAWLQVIDNGQGIDAGQVEQVFQPYWRAPGGSTRGSGLGLSIVREALQTMRLPPVGLRSVVGHGCAFTLRLPLLQAAAPSISLDGRLLLVVDDDAAQRQSLLQALVSLGATCLEAADAAQARGQLDSALRLPDALVIDLDLGTPGQDGADLIVALRAFCDDEIPALLVSAGVAVLTRDRPPLVRARLKPLDAVALGSALSGLLMWAETLRGDTDAEVEANDEVAQAPAAHSPEAP
jgi:signal transduction histidine kinase